MPEESDIYKLPWRRCPIGICVDEPAKTIKTRNSAPPLESSFKAPMRVVASLQDVRLIDYIIASHNGKLRQNQDEERGETENS